MTNDEHLTARRVYAAPMWDRRLALFDFETKRLVLGLQEGENPEIAARSMGWRFVQGEVITGERAHKAAQDALG